MDLYHEKLEIAICAQHNNGGLSTDAYWETEICGLFAVGEVCGSHGVTRPGGTALTFLKISGKHIGIGKNLRIFKQAIFVNSISNTWCREDYKNRAKIVDI